MLLTTKRSAGHRELAFRLLVVAELSTSLACLPAPAAEAPATRPAQSAPAPSLSPEMADAVAEAQKKLETETPRRQGALVYAITGSDGGRPEAKGVLEFKGGGRRMLPVDAVRPNTIYDRSTQTSVFRITAPGYHPFARELAFEPGRVLVWKDVVL